MITKTVHKGLKYTLATADTGGVCLNVYDDSTKSFIFNSGICKDKEQLISLIKKTKKNYNEMLDQCVVRLK